MEPFYFNDIKQLPHQLPETKYVLEEQIGKGSDSVVFRASCGKETVAIKLYAITKELSISQSLHFNDIRDSYEAEKEAILKIKGKELPHIVRYYKPIDQFHAIIMQLYEDTKDSWSSVYFAEECSIEEKLLRGLFWTHDVALGLKELWQNYQLIHRDIKPDNVLLQKKGSIYTPLITDFSIATTRLLPEEGDMGGYVKGTIYFISPEEASGGIKNLTTDLYSLTVSLYHIITGLTLFASTEDHAFRNEMEVLQKRFSNAFIQDIKLPDSFKKIGAGYDAVNAFIRKGCAPEKQHRYPDHDAYLGELNKIIELMGK